MNSNFSLIAGKDQFQKQKQWIQNEGERMKEKEKMEGIWQSQITFTITWRIMTKSAYHPDSFMLLWTILD